MKVSIGCWVLSWRGFYSTSIPGCGGSFPLPFPLGRVSAAIYRGRLASDCPQLFSLSSFRFLPQTKAPFCSPVSLQSQPALFACLQTSHALSCGLKWNFFLGVNVQSSGSEALTFLKCSFPGRRVMHKAMCCSVSHCGPAVSLCVGRALGGGVKSKHG